MLGFNLANAFAEPTDEGIAIAEFGGNCERELDHLRHETVVAEEVTRAMRFNRTVCHECPEPAYAWPVMDLLDQEILDRISRGVDELVEHVVSADEMNDADLLARPQILPATAEGVLTLGEHLVKVLDEFANTSVPVKDHGVMVVRHRRRYENVDVEPLRRFGEAVDERIVGFWIGSKKKLTLRTTTRDQVEAVWEDLTRQHDVLDRTSASTFLAKCNRASSHERNDQGFRNSDGTSAMRTFVGRTVNRDR